MIRLYRGRDKHRYPTRVPGVFFNLEKVININFDKITEYYSSVERKVINSNLLVRIIKTSGVKSHMNGSELLSTIDVMLPSILRHFEIISHVSNGASDYINMELEEDYFAIVNSYKNISYLKTMYTDDLSSGLNLSHPHYIPKDSINIYGLDVKALLIGYVNWSKHRLKNDLSLDPAIFIYTIVYGNLILDRFTYSLYTHITNNLLTRSGVKIKNKLPISILDYSSLLGGYVNLLVSEISRGRRQVKQPQLLKWIRLPRYGDAYKYLTRSYGFVNRNNESAILAIEGNQLYTIIEFQGRSLAFKKNNNLRIDLNQSRRTIFGNNIILKNPMLDLLLEEFKEKIIDL